MDNALGWEIKTRQRRKETTKMVASHKQIGSNLRTQQKATKAPPNVVVSSCCRTFADCVTQHPGKTNRSSSHGAMPTCWWNEMKYRIQLRNSIDLYARDPYPRPLSSHHNFKGRVVPLQLCKLHGSVIMPFPRTRPTSRVIQYAASHWRSWSKAGEPGRWFERHGNVGSPVNGQPSRELSHINHKSLGMRRVLFNESLVKSI